jgi:hypothetical protein
MAVKFDLRFEVVCARCGQRPRVAVVMNDYRECGCPYYMVPDFKLVQVKDKI